MTRNVSIEFQEGVLLKQSEQGISTHSLSMSDDSTTTPPILQVVKTISSG